MRLTFAQAGEADAEALAALGTAAADHLTAQFGKGPWSYGATAKGVLHAMRQGRVVIAKAGRRPVAVARLGTRKPWAIDVAYFTPCERPLYLTGMAVAPEHQRQGIGRRLLAEVIKVARRWPANAVRLDAYDTPAGAGEFYARSGFAFRGHVMYRGTPHVYYELVLADAASSSRLAHEDFMKNDRRR